jgi:hypothetical protein
MNEKEKSKLKATIRETANDLHKQIDGLADLKKLAKDMFGKANKDDILEAVEEKTYVVLVELLLKVERLHEAIESDTMSDEGRRILTEHCAYSVTGKLNFDNGASLTEAQKVQLKEEFDEWLTDVDNEVLY